MAAAALTNPVPAISESKSARKKKAKAEAANGHNAAVIAASIAVGQQEASEEGSVVADAEGSFESAYLKELQKQIRNINKKLAATQKLDAIIAENPGVSLDDLVAQRKINTDQRAAAQKKPQLQAQLADLEERTEHYQKLELDYLARLNKQREEMRLQHQQEQDRIRQETQALAVKHTSTELRKKLLVFSQFLRAAAAKRTIEEEAESEESRAFEGALLLVYGGDEKAVDTAINLIDSSDERVPSIEGIPLPITYAQVKQASVDHAPFQAEETWVDEVVEATNGGSIVNQSGIITDSSDPTIANAGLTEIDVPAHPNGTYAAAPVEPVEVHPMSAGDVGNIAGERWDTEVAAGLDKGGLDDNHETIPRPSEEVDLHSGTTASQIQPGGSSWADEPPSYESLAGTGNQAGENWDVKVAGQEKDNELAGSGSGGDSGNAELHTALDDGFHEVSNRHRGRGGRGRGGDGEFRGRGGRRGHFRGRGSDGEFRGGRGGGSRGDRSRGDGEFRGSRGGRGRGGPRGGGTANTHS